MVIYQIVYCSVPTKILSEEELTCMVAKARLYNNSNSITGILFYTGQQFLQILEGEQNVVKLLYGRVCRDSRHTSIITIFDGPAPHRLFPKWALSSNRVSSAALARLTGYLDPQHRAALLPCSYNDQEIIADLLYEFLEEQSPTDRPSAGLVADAAQDQGITGFQPPNGNSATPSHGPFRYAQR